MLNDYQEQLILNPSISFVGQGKIGSQGTYNTFLLKEHWLTFALHEDLFAEIKAGEPLSGTAAGEQALPWIWPWDIVNFLKDVSSGFLSVLARFPSDVHKLWSEINEAGISQEIVREIVRNDGDTWKRFFATLGSDREFIALQPEHARWCRVLGGLEPPSGRLTEEPLRDERVYKIVAAVAQGVMMILAPAIPIAGFISAVMIACVMVAAANPIGGVFVLAMVAVLLHLVLIGYALFVVIGIVWIVMQGLIIFSGSSLPVVTVQLPTLSTRRSTAHTAVLGKT